MGTVFQQPDQPPEHSANDTEADERTCNANGHQQRLTGVFNARIVVTELEGQQSGHQFVGGFIPLPRVCPAGFDDDFVELDQIPAFPVVLQVRRQFRVVVPGPCRC